MHKPGDFMASRLLECPIGKGDQGANKQEYKKELRNGRKLKE